MLPGSPIDSGQSSLFDASRARAGPVECRGRGHPFLASITKRVAVRELTLPHQLTAARGRPLPFSRCSTFGS